MIKRIRFECEMDVEFDMRFDLLKYDMVKTTYEKCMVEIANEKLPLVLDAWGTFGKVNSIKITGYDHDDFVGDPDDKTAAGYDNFDGTKRIDIW